MVERIYIAVPCFNRGKILRQCVPTIFAGKKAGDQVNLYNDHSTEYSSEWLRHFCDFVYESDRSIGIEEQRKWHFRDFWENRGAFQYLYLTDSDALHDPNWRSQALGLFHEHGRHPVCLYNTEAHASIIGNTIEDLLEENVVWRKYAPGISWLLSVDHVDQIVHYKGEIRSWDWNCCDILGRRMAISRTSYVDHIGHGGMHHPPDGGFDGGDRALNPTDWLREKRAEVVEALSK